MQIEISSTGFAGTFNHVEGAYSFSGTVSCDANKAIKSFAADITTGSGENLKKVGSFSVYLVEAESNVQDAIMGAIKAVRSSLDTGLDSE